MIAASADQLLRSRPHKFGIPVVADGDSSTVVMNNSDHKNTWHTTGLHSSANNNGDNQSSLSSDVVEKPRRPAHYIKDPRMVFAAAFGTGNK